MSCCRINKDCKYTDVYWQAYSMGGIYGILWFRYKINLVWLGSDLDLVNVLIDLLNNTGHTYLYAEVHRPNRNRVCAVEHLLVICCKIKLVWPAQNNGKMAMTLTLDIWLVDIYQPNMYKMWGIVRVFRFMLSSYDLQRARDWNCGLLKS
jgi:hypothetical protein